MAARVSSSNPTNPTLNFSQLIIECRALEKALEVSDTDLIVREALIETLKKIEGLISLFNLEYQALLQENAALKKQLYGGIEEKNIVPITIKNKSLSEGSLPKLSEITLLSQSKLKEIKYINDYIKLLLEKNNKLLQQNRDWALKYQKNLTNSSELKKDLDMRYGKCRTELNKVNADFKRRASELAKERDFTAALSRQIEDYVQQLNERDGEIQKLKDRIADLTPSS